jgi:Tfp pilus assembly protein PilX
MGIKSETGAVLVLSLVILLLVTLVGANMVQQNRLQFMMAINSQMQSNEFANAENMLRLTEKYIRDKRYVDIDTYECKKTAGSPPKFDQLKPQKEIRIAGLSEAISAKTNVSITKTSCMTHHIEIECMPDEINPSTWAEDETQCNQSDQSQCATEIYAIEIAVTDETGTNRVIESNYAVRCDV